MGAGTDSAASLLFAISRRLNLAHGARQGNLTEKKTAPQEEKVEDERRRHRSFELRYNVLKSVNLEVLGSKY
jgi:hypothetical protein